MDWNKKESGCCPISCIRVIFLLIPVIVMLFGFSLSVIGLDLPQSIDVNIENSESDDGNIGPVSSTFTFLIDNPSTIPRDKLECSLIIDGEESVLHWNNDSSSWMGEYVPKSEGIYPYVITLEEIGNETNSISIEGSVVVHSFSGPTENEQSEHDYHNDPMTYLVFSFVMTFASVSIMAGLFALKYGKKRSKITAVFMVLSGIIIWGIWITFNFILKSNYPDDTIFGMIHWVAAPLLKPFMALIGIFLGCLLSIFIFLTVIVRT